MSNYCYFSSYEYFLLNSNILNHTLIFNISSSSLYNSSIFIFNVKRDSSIRRYKFIQSFTFQHWCCLLFDIQQIYLIHLLLFLLIHLLFHWSVGLLNSILSLKILDLFRKTTADITSPLLLLKHFWSVIATSQWSCPFEEKYRVIHRGAATLWRGTFMRGDSRLIGRGGRIVFLLLL